MKGTRIIRKFLSVALALCLLLCCLPSVYAMGDWPPRPDKPTSGDCGPNAHYEIVDGVMTISGTGVVTALLADFPSTLTKVIIEEGIIALVPDASLAFMHSITDVEIPSTLRYVGACAFSGSSWLESQTDEFVIVGDGILLDYNGPAGEVVIPEGVKCIANIFRIDLTLIYPDGYSNPWIVKEVAVIPTENYTQHLYNRFLVMDGVLMASECGGIIEVVTVPDEVHTIVAGGLRGYFAEVTVPETVTKLEENSIASLMGDEMPVLLRGALGSVAQEYAENDPEQRFRFMPFGGDNQSILNFIIRRGFNRYQFFDMTGDDYWFIPAVETVYRTKLMNGTAENYFTPYGQIKMNEAVTVAARVRDIYYDGQTDFSTDSTWYLPYVDYALANGIISQAPDSWERPATRAEFASMLAAALPEREFEAINPDVAFTDIDETHPAYAAVMLLAKAGVMQGRGDGTFDPDAQVQRCEAAAMLARCIRTGQRIQAE